MSTDELRKRYLDFFVAKDHRLILSDSLVPRNDPTLLFTGAGMNQFKEEFLGRVQDYRRAVTCQKCLRTPDLEKVGQTSGHHTFFEMLGNFSFGDYFKCEAVLWAWEFLTKELHLPQEKLLASVYEDDEEAFGVWAKEIGLPKEKIYRFDAHENFWPANAPTQGPNGPCGPCSEIFYDRGAEFSCGRPGCDVSCSCPRYVEIWNLVFTQFDRRDDGTLAPLLNKNIDTGMGLERMASVLQGVRTNFQIDIFKPIVQEICRQAEVKYGCDPEQDSHIHALADHIRAITFVICDGVLPANEGRGYVERMLIRRSIRHGRAIGINKFFLYSLVPIVVEVMKQPYPEMVKRRENISQVVLSEEKRYERTIKEGSRILNEKLDNFKVKGKKEIPDSGEIAFELYDTYGLPLDITEEIASKYGYGIDRPQFREALKSRQQQSREGSKMTGDIFADELLSGLDKQQLKTEFKGYEGLESESQVISIYKGGQQVEEVEAPDEVEIVLDRTPFYGEAGGQTGDRGWLEAEGLKVEIMDAKQINECVVHSGRIKSGKLSVGRKISAYVDPERRMDIARNHTATHLLHWALRQVLGEHVQQAGSLVAPDRLRFDFTHFKEVHQKQLSRIEELVNCRIIENVPVGVQVMVRDKAIASGAIALFGEKYGQQVRVVSLGDFSRELCGGTHLSRTGQIGVFKITHEGSIASGTRRIEAQTGPWALEAFRQDSFILEELKELLKTSKEKVVAVVTGLQEDLRQANRELSKLQDKEVLNQSEALGSTKDKVVTGILDVSTMDQLRRASDVLMDKKGKEAVVLAASSNEKAYILIRLSEKLVKKGLNADKIIKEICPLVEGSGGGRERMAQGSGTKIKGLDEALKQAMKIIDKESRS